VKSTSSGTMSDLLRLSGDGSGTRWGFRSDEEVRAGPEDHREPGTPNPVPARSPERPMPPDPEYGTSDYWERRYAERVDEQTFEWYGSFVALEDAIVAALPSTKALILHVGNGNSALPERLWACGYTWQHASDISQSVHPACECSPRRDSRFPHRYKWQHASDISPTVISRMAERTRDCEGLHWAVEDATCMPHAMETFDAIIDKGTYDALATGSYRERALVSEAWRVLRTGGVYILISSLESTELALGPPAWRQGEWHVSKSRVETGMGRRCFVFRAIKRQGTTDASLHADCD